jgi:hypothetical protein
MVVDEDHHNLLHDGVFIANTFEGGEETYHLFATLESWNDRFLKPFKDTPIAFALCSQGTYLLQYKFGKINVSGRFNFKDMGKEIVWHHKNNYDEDGAHITKDMCHFFHLHSMNFKVLITNRSFNRAPFQYFSNANMDSFVVYLLFNV